MWRGGGELPARIHVSADHVTAKARVHGDASLEVHAVARAALAQRRLPQRLAACIELKRAVPDRLDGQAATIDGNGIAALRIAEHEAARYKKTKPILHRLQGGDGSNFFDEAGEHGSIIGVHGARAMICAEGIADKKIAAAFGRGYSSA